MFIETLHMALSPPPARSIRWRTRKLPTGQTITGTLRLTAKLDLVLRSLMRNRQRQGLPWKYFYMSGTYEAGDLGLFRDLKSRYQPVP